MRIADGCYDSGDRQRLTQFYEFDESDRFKALACFPNPQSLEPYP